MHYRYHLLILLALLSFLGCEYSTDDPIPGYIEIDKISLDHENAIGITDAWVSVDGNVLGVYELPTRFPVIAEGPTVISVRPGIKVNGITDTRTYYPFYEPYEINIDFEAKKTYNISPRSRYDDWVTKIMVDDFEGQVPYFKNDNSSDTTMFNTGTDVFQGSKAGVIHLDTLVNVRHYEAATIEKFNVPDFTGNYSGMFLEMNFKCDNSVAIGLIIEESPVRVESLMILYPTDNWKKIYIDLYNTLVYSNEGTKFKIYVEANIDKDNANAEIYLDDMKIVH